MFGEKLKIGSQAAVQSVFSYLFGLVRFLPYVVALLLVVGGILYVGYKAGFVMATQRHFQGFNVETGTFTLRGASVYLSGNCTVLNSDNLINLLYHEAKVTYVDDKIIIAVLSNLKEPMSVQCAVQTTTVDNLSYPDIRDALGKVTERPGKYSLVIKQKEEVDEIIKFKGQAVIASGVCRSTSDGAAIPSFTGKILDVLSVEKQGDKTAVYAIRREDQISLVCDSKSFMARFATDKDLAPPDKKEEVVAGTNYGNASESDMAQQPTQIDYEGKTVLVKAVCNVRTKDNTFRKMNLINTPIEVSKYRLSADGKFEYLQGLSGEVEGQVFCNRSEWPISVVLKTSNITLKSFDNKNKQEQKGK